MGATTALCTLCMQRKPVYCRPYSGERLCRKCFVKSIEDKARTTIAKYGMLKFDDRVAIALSGGKDSVSLLHIMARMRRKHPKSSLVAITVDEGIRNYRDEALKIAADNCKRLDVEHIVVSFGGLFGHTLDEIVKLLKNREGESVTPCAYCGVLRRKALNMAARETGANKLATAHTLDDETQTILLNIFRGDTWRLAKEKPVTDEAHPKLVRRIKPFCEIPERETALYAYLKRIGLQSRPCPYASEALRNDARVMLNRMEERHAGTKFTIFRSIEKIRPSLEEVAKTEGLRECSECGEPTTERTCRTCQMLKHVS